MKYKDESGQWKDLVLPATGDTLPVGTVVEFEGDTVPSNWTKVEEIEFYKTLLDLLCPVGKVEVFFDNNDHSKHLGFTWERTLIGRVPVGVNANEEEFNWVGKTGGEKAHQLTINEMPSHQHMFKFTKQIKMPETGDEEIYFGISRNWNTSNNENITEISGENQPHNILQPYEVVAFWKRVS